MINRSNWKKIYNIIYFLIPVAFYVFFCVYDGVIWCADSESYVEMYSSREPLYPSYLALLRVIFGQTQISLCGHEQELYLFLAVLGQSILAALTTWSLARYMAGKFNLNRLFGLAILTIPLMTSLLCRFAAKRSSMYSNSILTEGITISLYLLFFRFGLELLLDKTKKSYIISSIIVILSMLCRKQMSVLLILLILIVIFNIFNCDNKKIPKILGLLITVLLITISVGFFDRLYNLFINNDFRKHTADNRFLTTMAFYTSERDDVKYIDPRLQDVWLDIYDACDDQGLLMHDAPKDWYNAVSHFADNYDHIQIDTMADILGKYKDEVDYSYLGPGEAKDMIRASFNKSILPHKVPQLLKVFIYNFMAGLVTTVAVRRPILCVYTLIVFIFYLLLLYFVWRGARNKNEATDTYTSIMLLGLFTLFSIFANVGLVSAVIFTQTRYTIYNMPLFYMTLIIMLFHLFNNRNKQ